jgi:hypothetical protein
VPRDDIMDFQTLFKDSLGAGGKPFDAALIGHVTDTPELACSFGGEDVLRVSVEEAAKAFKAALNW